MFIQEPRLLLECLINKYLIELDLLLKHLACTVKDVENKNWKSQLVWCLFEQHHLEKGGILLPKSHHQVCGGGCAALPSAPWSWGQLGAWPQPVTPTAEGVAVCLCVCKDPQAKFPPPRVEGMYFIMALDWFQMSRDYYRGKTVCKGHNARNGLSAWVALLQACWAQFSSGIGGEKGELVSQSCPLLCSSSPRKPSLDQYSSLPEKQTEKMDTLVAWALNQAHAICWAAIC